MVCSDDYSSLSMQVLLAENSITYIYSNFRKSQQAGHYWPRRTPLLRTIGDISRRESNERSMLAHFYAFLCFLLSILVFHHNSFSI